MLHNKSGLCKGADYHYQQDQPRTKALSCEGGNSLGTSGDSNCWLLPHEIWRLQSDCRMIHMNVWQKLLHTLVPRLSSPYDAWEWCKQARYQLGCSLKSISCVWQECRPQKQQLCWCEAQNCWNSHHIFLNWLWWETFCPSLLARCMFVPYLWLSLAGQTPSAWKEEEVWGQRLTKLVRMECNVT